MHTPAGLFEQTYPMIARWVESGGYVEIGHDGFSSSFVRALDEGGMIWEGEPHYPTLNDALQALDLGIRAWIAENRL